MTIYIQRPKDDLPDRVDFDHYPTETDLVLESLYAVLYGVNMTVKSILDIGAGSGVWGKTAREICPLANQVDGVEIRETKNPGGFDDWVIADYLNWTASRDYDLIVSNPPYKYAEPIIRKAWRELAPGGQMVMLLRLAFAAGVKRYESLWREIPLAKLLIVSRRPSFYDRSTNGTDYGVFVWGKDDDGRALGSPRAWPCELLLHQREPLSSKGEGGE